MDIVFAITHNEVSNQEFHLQDECTATWKYNGLLNEAKDEIENGNFEKALKLLDNFDVTPIRDVEHNLFSFYLYEYERQLHMGICYASLQNGVEKSNNAITAFAKAFAYEMFYMYSDLNKDNMYQDIKIDFLDRSVAWVYYLEPVSKRPHDSIVISPHPITLAKEIYQYLIDSDGKIQTLAYRHNLILMLKIIAAYQTGSDAWIRSIFDKFLKRIEAPHLKFPSFRKHLSKCGRVLKKMDPSNKLTVCNLVDEITKIVTRNSSTQYYYDKIDTSIDDLDIGPAEKAIKYADMGIMCKRSGEYQKATAYYRKALELDPKSGMLYYNLGKALYLIGDFEAAQNAYYLAYVYEAPVLKENIHMHIGHAVLDGRKNKDHQAAIDFYYNSIAGKPTFSMKFDQHYDKLCCEEGKKTLLSLKEKLNRYEADKIQSGDI